MFEKKKSLGQNFLTSTHYLALIADTARLEKDEWALEIGPGEGTLTQELLARGANVVAVEKDHRLIPILAEKFAQELGEGRLSLIEGDALEKNIEIVEPYKLVANIPYYVTGAILEKFLSHEHQPTSAVLLVQKEVAERIAREKKESILSLSVKAYGNPKYIKTVPAGAFSPPPKVDSAILSIENISRANFTDRAHEKKFFDLLHAGFAHKRKLLARNLEAVLGDKAAGALASANIAANVRAEDVPLKGWLELARFRYR
ncbi:MAG TPA: 16S rRNA (adenine(1518)-N(6)/adenine(1519)-N(6))-dimethyltransferase RsmA [Candidatus Paceibacterota bacterium]|nr:16S rRNA (adenine(1518)-N(6)/adenine(1519)-N(6))-dimethyltransferase RsmA [Candidatus Paceibacterota bacterium]